MTKIQVLFASLTIALAAAGAGKVQAADKAAADKAPAVAKAGEKAGDKAPEKADKTKAAPAAGKAEAGEVTLKGELTCAKCGLHEAKECQNVLKVKDAAGGKETKYYVSKNTVSDENHKKVCKGALLPATVTGKVSDQDGKKVITPSALKID